MCVYYSKNPFGTNRGFHHSYLYVLFLINLMSEILTNVYKNEHIGVGERAQQVKCLLCKHGSSVQVPNTQENTRQAQQPACNSKLWGGRNKSLEQACQLNQPNQQDPGVSERLPQNITKQETIKKGIQSQPLSSSTHTHLPTHKYTNAHAHLPHTQAKECFE